VNKEDQKKINCESRLVLSRSGRTKNGGYASLSGHGYKKKYSTPKGKGKVKEKLDDKEVSLGAATFLQKRKPGKGSVCTTPERGTETNKD